MNTSTLQLQRPQGPLPSRQPPGDGSTMLGAQAVSDLGRSEEAMPTARADNATDRGIGAARNFSDQRPKDRLTTTLSIASINSCGLSGTRTETRNKLTAIVRVMRESKWGLIGIQETHESEAAASTLETFNAKVWAFPNPGTAMSAGTTMVLYRDFFPNKQITRGDCVHRILVPGRAQALTIPWREGETITVVNVYAPNDMRDAIGFFRTLKTKLRRHPDVLLGDFNHVEHAIDRIPQCDTHQDMRNALAELRTGLGLTDRWREAHPGVHSYTWTSAGLMNGSSHRSRLDRILTSQDMTHRTQRWNHQTSQNISDHDFVTIDVVDERDPVMGTSRWKMNAEELASPYLREETRKILVKTENQINKGKDPMLAWLHMKAKIRTVFIEKKRQLTKLRSAKMANLANDRDKCKAHPDYATSEQIQRNCKAIEQRIADIKEHKTAQAVLTQTARYGALGESVSKYWFSIGKGLMRESMIRSLKDEDGNAKCETPAMLEIAARHHERLMSQPTMSPQRLEAIRKMTELAKESALSPPRAERLAAPLTEGEAELAIKVSQGGKAPGEDGISYKFYKLWAEVYRNRDPDGPPVPSITSMMIRAWNAPSRKEAAPQQYVTGLMALLYKKGDKELAANYRPITLLNTDEKLETKCLATRMGMALPSIIHPDQAGFVPGRDILDHVKLAKIVAEYCEVTEQDGCLVALDQEKAYDRIDHEYLWKILEAYGVPVQFTQRVKALYANATTKVMINRQTSRPFKVQRGVRQGDPMSCLLFDLAIEPLAETLRRSNLKGIRVPGQAARLVCKLFADDTQLYLAKSDSYKEAMSLAEEWTIASTAKFNESKTEILPMGRERYRNKVAQTRTLSGTAAPAAEQLPPGAKIFEMGESLRILGGQVGYNLDIEEVWQPAIAKMEKAAKKWAARPMTMKGRAIVASFLILSTAQYLTMVNEPHEKTIKKVDQIVRRMVWRGKTRGILKQEILAKPKEQGGIGLPLLAPRVRAARLMWLKKWRRPQNERPLWSRFLDRMIKANNSDKSEKPWMKSFLDQTWKTTKMSLSKETRNLLKEADTSNLVVDALKMGKRPKGETLLWRTSDSNKSKQQENSVAARRLWLRHGINTQAALWRIKTTPYLGCNDHHKCIAAAEEWIMGLKPKFNLLEHTPVNRRTGTKDNLDLTQRRRDANTQNRTLGNPIILDPSVTHNEAKSAASRVFAPAREAKDEIAYRQVNLNTTAGTTIVYTDGSADLNGSDNSACGAGLWSKDEGISGSFRVPGYPPTNNRGELAAATLALERVPLNRRLILRTDSMYVLDFLDGGFQKWEDLGWLNVPNKDLLKRCLFLLRRRTAETLIQKVKAHSGEPGNEAADEAAKKALVKARCDEINTEVPPKWDLQGAKLATLSFHNAYEWALEERAIAISDRGKENIEQCATFVEALTGKQPSTTMIWTSLRDPAIRRKISDFLWQAMHGRTVCGPFFRHWGDEWQQRQFCRCGALETLQHILCGCQERQWRADLWEEYRAIEGMAEARGRRTPLIPEFGEIMTIGLTKTKSKPSTRIHKILVTETAYVIWKMRNEEVIQEERIHPRRAIATLHAALFRRAQTDLRAARLPDNPLRR